MKYATGTREFICGKCGLLIDRLIPGNVDIATPTVEECRELEADMERVAARSPKDMAEHLVSIGRFRTPADAAQSIGYEWTTKDQAEWDRVTYVQPITVDKCVKSLAAIRDAKKGHAN